MPGSREFRIFDRGWCWGVGLPWRYEAVSGSGALRDDQVLARGLTRAGTKRKALKVLARTQPVEIVYPPETEDAP
jgi:hypothetical protein